MDTLKDEKRMSLTPQYILQGYAYALEQCGQLLRDANVLYRNQSYASALVLAAFAQETWTLNHTARFVAASVRWGEHHDKATENRPRESCG